MPSSPHTPRWSVPVTPIPAKAGIGLKFDHAAEIIENRSEVGWFEVHAENYMGDGGRPIETLERIARDYPISVHGVGLSIGGVDDLDEDHLARLERLVRRIGPGLVSEHLAWCAVGGDHLSDLLPLPYTKEALDVVCAHVDQVQERLGRQILIENPSLYVAFEASEMIETEFLSSLTKRTGCGLILDVNNVYVSASNLGYDAAAYVCEIDASTVGEIHLAGHHLRDLGDRILLIDDHGSSVSDPVWDLYAATLGRTGRVPTLIEWDNNIPALDVLVKEAAKAETILDRLFETEVSHDRAA
jgi:uncharacterized protein (UPF0276 family)